MKMFSISAMVAAVALVAAGSAHAGSAGANFDVNLTLTPTCIITNSSGGTSAATLSTNIGIAYSAFQTSPGTGFTSFYVRCSTDLGFSLGLAASTGIVDGTTGLSYNLALKTANSGDASTGVGTLGSQTGVAAGTQYFVQAYVGGGQAGTTTPGTANNTRTVTVTY